MAAPAARSRSLGTAFGAIAIVDRDLDAVDAAVADGYRATHGSGGERGVLAAAGIADAITLVIATPTLAEKMRICLTARALSPGIRLITFADGDGEAAWLREFGVDELIELRSEVANFVRRRI